MFINELKLYVDYLKNEIDKCSQILSQKEENFLYNFKVNLLNGINYYKTLAPELKKETAEYIDRMIHQLSDYQEQLNTLPITSKVFIRN